MARCGWKVSVSLSGLLLLLLRHVAETNAEYTQINMGDHWINNCFETFVEAGGIASAYTEEFVLFSPSKYVCQVTIKTLHPDQRFYLRFERLEVYSEYGDCFDHRLDIFDGANRAEPKMTGTRGLCTQYQEDPVLPMPMLSSTDAVTFYLYREATVRFPALFRIVFAAFKNNDDGDCFQCENNTALCMDESLKCDSLNHCADGSDESYNGEGGCSESELYRDITEYGIVITSVIIVLLILIVLTVVIVAICYYRQRHGNPPKRFVHRPRADVVNTKRAPQLTSIPANSALGANYAPASRYSPQVSHQDETPAGYTPGEGAIQTSDSDSSSDSIEEKV